MFSISTKTVFPYMASGLMASLLFCFHAEAIFFNSSEEQAKQIAVALRDHDSTLDIFSSEARLIAGDLHEAVKEEDSALYAKKMRFLLEVGNIETFLQVLMHMDKDGNNIFHFMAKVGTPEARKFFADEMRFLFDLFTGRLEPGTGRVFAGRKIDIPPLSERGLWFRLYQDSTQGETSEKAGLDSEDILKFQEEITRLKQGPFINFIQRLSAFPLSNASPQEGLSENQERLLEKWRLLSRILRDKTNKLLFAAENKSGKRPLDIAYETENAPAWRILKETASLSDIRLVSPDWLVTGALMASVAMTASYFIDLSLASEIVLIVGMIIVSYQTIHFPVNSCRRIFRKMRIKRLEEKAGQSASM